MFSRIRELLVHQLSSFLQRMDSAGKQMLRRYVSLYSWHVHPAVHQCLLQSHFLGCTGSMQSLESFNRALGVLHNWDSSMSLDDVGESELDARIAAACLHLVNIVPSNFRLCAAVLQAIGTFPTIAQAAEQRLSNLQRTLVTESADHPQPIPSMVPGSCIECVCVCVRVYVCACLCVSIML